MVGNPKGINPLYASANDPDADLTSLVFAGRTHPVRALMLRLTQLFDVTGHPAITVPCARSADRLPVGLQLVGRRGRTAELLVLAAAVERTLADQD